MTALHSAQLFAFDSLIDHGAADASQRADFFDSVGPLLEELIGGAAEFSGGFRGGRSGADEKYGCSVTCSKTSIARRR
jgi:hypothetical protein